MPKYDQRSRALARDLHWDENDKETYQCPDCGRGVEMLLDTFDVHHKNGEVLDNRRENRVGVCRVCHNLREGKKPNLDRIRHLRSQLKTRINTETGDESDARVEDAPEGAPSDETPDETVTASAVFSEGVEAYSNRESDDAEVDLEDLFEDTDRPERDSEEIWEELEEMFDDKDDDSGLDEDEDPWERLENRERGANE